MKTKKEQYTLVKSPCYTFLSFILVVVLFLKADASSALSQEKAEPLVIGCIRYNRFVPAASSNRIQTPYADTHYSQFYSQLPGGIMPPAYWLDRFGIFAVICFLFLLF